MVYIHDVAHVRDGNPPQHNIVHVDGNRSVLMFVLKNGGVSTLAIIDGVKKKVQDLKRTLPSNLVLTAIGDQSIFINARDRRRHPRRRHCGRTNQPDDFAVSRQLPLDADHCNVNSAFGARLDRNALGFGRNPQHHDARRIGAGRRHPRRRSHGDDREHQLAPRTRQRGRDRDIGRRRADRDAGVCFIALHLHRVRADVLPRPACRTSSSCRWRKR